MNTFVRVLPLLFAACNLYADDVKLMDGRILKNAEVSKVDPAFITFTYDDGILRAPFEIVPRELQEKYRFDPQKAATFTQRAVDARAELLKQKQKDAQEKVLREKQKEADAALMEKQKSAAPELTPREVSDELSRLSDAMREQQRENVRQLRNTLETQRSSLEAQIRVLQAQLQSASDTQARTKNYSQQQNALIAGLRDGVFKAKNNLYDVEKGISKLRQNQNTAP